MFNRSQDKKTSLPAPMVLLPESEEPPPIVVAPVFSLLAGTRLSEDEDPYCRASSPLRFISGWR